MPKRTKLRKKQERFVREYLACSNATQAAISAGYSQRSATQVASRILTYDDIKKRIEELEREKYEELGITHSFILGGLKRLAVSNEVERPMVSVRAYELLGNHKGTFDDKVDKTGERPVFVGVKIIMGNGEVKVLGNDNKDLIDIKPNKALKQGSNSTPKQA